MAWLTFDKCYCFNLDQENGAPIIFYLQRLSRGIWKRIFHKAPKVLGSETPGCAVFASDKGKSQGILTWIKTWLDPSVCTFRNLSCVVSLLSGFRHTKGKEANPYILRKPQEYLGGMEMFIMRGCCILSNGTKDPSFSLFKQSSFEEGVGICTVCGSYSVFFYILYTEKRK